MTTGILPSLPRVTGSAPDGTSEGRSLRVVAGIWREHPEVIGYDSVVDARDLTSEGGWTWPVLREIAGRWHAFARRCAPFPTVWSSSTANSALIMPRLYSTVPMLPLSATTSSRAPPSTSRTPHQRST